MSRVEFETVYVISVAAELAGMHPQTLRQYDRLGLVSPMRTAGRGRRYTPEDVADLREIQRLSQEEGINLAGIKRIMNMRKRLQQLEHENQQLRRTVDGLQRHQARIFSAGPSGEVAMQTNPQTRNFESQAVIRYVPSRQVVLWGSQY